MKLCRRPHGNESSPSITGAFCALYKDDIRADSRPIRVHSRLCCSRRSNPPAQIIFPGRSVRCTKTTFALIRAQFACIRGCAVRDDPTPRRRSFFRGKETKPQGWLDEESVVLFETIQPPGADHFSGEVTTYQALPLPVSHLS